MSSIMRARSGLTGVLLIGVLLVLRWRGLVAPTSSGQGTSHSVQLSQLIVSVYLTCIMFVVVVLGIIAGIAGFNIFKFARYLREELLVVFGATSAEAMIPRTMGKLVNIGVSKDIVGLVIPTGFSFNM